jgi:hypothetical protein
MNQAKLSTVEELLFSLCQVYLEETVQDTIIETGPSCFQAFASHGMLCIRLIELVVIEFDTSILRDFGCFIKIMVTFKEAFSQRPIFL